MSSATLDVMPRVSLKDVLLIKNKVFGDARGFFVESYNARTFAQATGLSLNFVQDNHSRSSKGVLRGIHYQLTPHAQGKLVRVANGSVFDVAVDLRKSSPTFGKWVGHTLTAIGGEMLWIPPGFGHGFVTLEDNTDLIYKTTDFYAPESEACVAWNDPTIGIDWPKEVLATIQLSSKDQAAPRLENARVFE